MRCTVASVTALATTTFVVALCLADGPDKPKANKPKADKSNTETGPSVLEKIAKYQDSRNAKIEAEINDNLVGYDFQGTPLTDVLDYIHQKYLPTARYVLDQAALKDAGIDPTTSLVTISIRDVHLKTALDLTLASFDLGYYVRDGLLIVTTKDKVDATFEIRIYDCRELLLADIGRFPGRDLQTLAEGERGTIAKEELHTPVDKLIKVITTSIAPHSWAEAGGPGTICPYGGLLIVNANSEVHFKVADLLDKLSTQLASPPPK